MNMSSYADRIGGFAAVNTGIIEDCYTESKVISKRNAAGFVYENTGEINVSIAQNKMNEGENCAEFICKNKGTVSRCAWIRGKRKKKNDVPETETPGQTPVDQEQVDKIKEILNLDDKWKVTDKGKKAKIGFDYSKIHFAEETEGAEIIEISDAKQLFDISAAIAAGDADAAKAHYRLTKNINLHGKKWLPIGTSEQAPFRGIFDGCNHKIYNFTVRAAGLPYAGFFGYVKNSTVCNLKIDCEVNGKKGSTTGAMCGACDRGVFANCHVVAKVSAEKCFGGFMGKNMGAIVKSSFVGKVSHILPPIIFIIPSAGLAATLMAVGIGVAVGQMHETPYHPIIIDPNQKPHIEESTYTPPPAGTNRISFELNQEVYINVYTQVGLMNYVNPGRSTQDVVVSVRISDAELLRTVGRTGRPALEQAQLEASENYDPENSYQELYRSGRLEIGYELEAVKLAALKDGTTLPVGDYKMMVCIDAYDPVTHEKAVVNANAPITVHIVEPKPQA